MSGESKKILLTFSTTRDVIVAERECKALNLHCIAVPTPREFSSQCGIALEILEDEKTAIFDLLSKLKKPYKLYDKNNPPKNTKQCKI